MENSKICDEKMLENRLSKEVAINCFQSLVVKSEDESRETESRNFYEPSIKQKNLLQDVKNNLLKILVYIKNKTKRIRCD